MGNKTFTTLAIVLIAVVLVLFIPDAIDRLGVLEQQFKQCCMVRDYMDDVQIEGLMDEEVCFEVLEGAVLFKPGRRFLRLQPIECGPVKDLDPAPMAAQTLEQRMSTLEGKVHNCCSIYTRDDPTHKNTVLLRKLDKLEDKFTRLERKVKDMEP